MMNLQQSISVLLVDLGINMKKLSLISLFAGCGGSSLGYRLATGFDEKLAVEWWKPAAETLRINFPEVKVISEDISKITGKELLNHAGLTSLDVLDGSPPCQGFSICGTRKVLDPRNNLVNHYIRLIHETRPRAFVMENVKGMIIGKMKSLFNGFMLKMRAEGYTVFAKLMSAKFYGVPQDRNRVIIVGFKEKKCADKWQWPVPSKTVISAGDALRNITPDEIYEYKKDSDTFSNIQHLQIGKNVSDLVTTMGFTTQRLDPFKPCPTVTTKPEIIHWEEQVRVLALSEVKVLCSFPADYKMSNYPISVRWKQLGNSVPPKMMKAIATQVKNALQTL
jgi:DNA (cytosine-5)-methyltransferase 1